MRLLKTGTIEEQIGELDAYMDDMVRKPRKCITNVVTQIPGGCLLEPVVNDMKIFVGFFTVEGSLSNLVAQLPLDAKPSQLVIESVADNVTNSVTFQIAKGQNSFTNPIDIKANTKVSVSINSSDPIESALVGYIFTPKVS